MENIVIFYLCDCIKVGYEVDWGCFCDEVGFIREMVLVVCVVVERVGLIELLKLIKE